MNVIHRLTRAAAFLIGLALLTFTVQAQDATMPTATVENVPVWVQHFGEQLSQELESPVEEVRHQALQHAAYFASFYGDQIDLSAALPNLLEIYRQDGDEACRLLAVAAIHAIGDEPTMRAVRKMTGVWEDPSMRVRLVTLAALADYYGIETFAGDRDATRLARGLFSYYTEPRVIVHPPVVIPPENTP